MTTPEPQGPAPSAMPSFQLNDEAKRRLRELLVFPASAAKDNQDFAQVTREVESWRFVAAVSESDFFGPALGTYPRVIASIRDHAAKLLQKVRTLRPLIKALLGSKGANLQQVEIVLTSLGLASDMLESELKSQKRQRGPREHQVQHEIVGQLRGIFKRHYRGPREVRKMRGAIKRPSVVRKLEIEFVGIALRDLGTHFHFSNQKLIRLFDDPRCAPRVPTR